MNKLFRFIKVATLSFCLCLLIVSPMTAFAEESPESVENSATQSEQVVEDNSLIIAEKNQLIEDLIEQNNRNQKTIEDYRALYSTWTAVIGTLFVLFGIILPIVITIGLDKWNKRDIKNEVEKMQKESQKQYERLMMAQNALALSSLEDYWASNECFKKLQEKYPDDEYIKIYIARNSFRDLCSTLNDNEDKIPEYEDQLYETINVFIDWFYETDGKLLEEMMIGSIFGSSTVHEVAILISYLGNCDETNAKSDFIKICKKASQYVLDTLNVKSEDELFDWDQTNVFIMNYKQINYYLCEAYYRNKSISLKKQLQKTIRLYDADDFSREDDNLQKCRKMLEEIG